MLNIKSQMEKGVSMNKLSGRWTHCLDGQLLGRRWQKHLPIDTILSVGVNRKRKTKKNAKQKL